MDNLRRIVVDSDIGCKLLVQNVMMANDKLEVNNVSHETSILGELSVSFMIFDRKLLLEQSLKAFINDKPINFQSIFHFSSAQWTASFGRSES